MELPAPSSKRRLGRRQLRGSDRPRGDDRRDRPARPLRLARRGRRRSRSSRSAHRSTAAAVETVVHQVVARVGRRRHRRSSSACARSGCTTAPPTGTSRRCSRETCRARRLRAADDANGLEVRRRHRDRAAGRPGGSRRARARAGRPQRVARRARRPRRPSASGRSTSRSGRRTPPPTLKRNVNVRRRCVHVDVGAEELVRGAPRCPTASARRAPAGGGTCARDRAEHLADEAVRRPARERDRAARAGHADELGRGAPVVGREHRRRRPRRRVEGAVGERERPRRRRAEARRAAARRRRARRRARAASGRSRSPVTSQPSRAAAIAMLPLPLATSSTVEPARRSAASARRSAIGTISVPISA